MSVQPFLVADVDKPMWIRIRDGNETAMTIFLRHYTARQQRKIRQFIGPGEKMPLLTPDASALFCWRKFINDDGQQGVNCAVFRNEGTAVASGLILGAELEAQARWPRERFYTYVDPVEVKPTMFRGFPVWGWCFYKAGWKFHGVSKSGKIILDKEADPLASPVRGKST